MIEPVSTVRDMQTVPLMYCVGSVSNSHCSLEQEEHNRPRLRSHAASAAMEFERAARCVQNTTIVLGSREDKDLSRVIGSRLDDYCLTFHAP